MLLCATLAMGCGKVKKHDPGYCEADEDCVSYYDKDPAALNPPNGAIIYNSKLAAQVSRFARKHRGKNIVIHCAAGISRSGGIAEALLAAFPEYEDKGWPRFPNGLVLALTKRALGLIPIGAEE